MIKIKKYRINKVKFSLFAIITGTVLPFSIVNIIAFSFGARTFTLESVIIMIVPWILLNFVFIVELFHKLEIDDKFITKKTFFAFKECNWNNVQEVRFRDGFFKSITLVFMDKHVMGISLLYYNYEELRILVVNKLLKNNKSDILPENLKSLIDSELS